MASVDRCGQLAGNMSLFDNTHRTAAYANAAELLALSLQISRGVEKRLLSDTTGVYPVASRFTRSCDDGI